MLHSSAAIAPRSWSDSADKVRSIERQTAGPMLPSLGDNGAVSKENTQGRDRIIEVHHVRTWVPDVSV